MPTKKTHRKIPGRLADTLALKLGPEIELTIHAGKKRAAVAVKLDDLIANFQNVVDEPQIHYKLQDYCGERFFVKNSGLSSADVYKQTIEGNADGAEWFVEYGAHIGSLLANLETLFRPNRIILTGPLTAWFDAWSHSMGKTRKQHFGDRPVHCVEVKAPKGVEVLSATCKPKLSKKRATTKRKK